MRWRNKYNGTISMYGEDKFVMLMGGLHIEMAALRLVGHWLEGSGWVESLIQATVATSGVAASFIHASHVKRTRYAHTVTAAALFISLQRCYASYVKQHSDGIVLDFDSWCSERQNSSVQFKFWYTAMELETFYPSYDL